MPEGKGQAWVCGSLSACLLATLTRGLRGESAASVISEGRTCRNGVSWNEEIGRLLREGVRTAGRPPKPWGSRGKPDRQAERVRSGSRMSLRHRVSLAVSVSSSLSLRHRPFSAPGPTEGSPAGRGGLDRCGQQVLLSLCLTHGGPGPCPRDRAFRSRAPLRHHPTCSGGGLPDTSWPSGCAVTRGPFSLPSLFHPSTLFFKVKLVVC